MQTQDAMKKPLKAWPKPAQSAEATFARQLRKVAKATGFIIGVHIDGTKILDDREMQRRLNDYSKSLEPWARKQAATMLLKVSAAGKRAMRANARTIGQGMRLVAESSVGIEAAKLMEEQVELIKSIPLKAGERAQKLAMEAIVNGSRADEIAERLMRSGPVAESDAVLIARSEVARANSVFTQARATSVGSTHYRWRNSGDAAVRHSHLMYNGKKLDGQIFSWASPPTLDDGTTGHPGTFPNCRCYPEPVFTD